MRHRNFVRSTRRSKAISSGKVENQYLVGSVSSSGHSIRSHSSARGSVSKLSRCPTGHVWMAPGSQGFFTYRHRRPIAVMCPAWWRDARPQALMGSAASREIVLGCGVENDLGADYFDRRSIEMRAKGRPSNRTDRDDHVA